MVRRGFVRCLGPSWTKHYLHASLSWQTFPLQSKATRPLWPNSGLPSGPSVGMTMRSARTHLTGATCHSSAGQPVWALLQCSPKLSRKHHQSPGAGSSEVSRANTESEVSQTLVDSRLPGLLMLSESRLPPLYAGEMRKGSPRDAWDIFTAATQ